MLEPIKKTSVSDAVVARIRDSISRGELKPGDQLPPERDLAIQLGVSRLAMREGLKVLAAMGLVDARQGEGTFITRPTSRSLLDPAVAGPLLDAAEMLELVEARTVLEVEIVGLAARRASPEHLAALEARMHTMTENLAAGADFLQADLEFHETILAAAGNRILSRIYGNINDLVFHLLEETHNAPGSGERAVRSHREILASVKARDETRARRAMRTHMANVRADLELLISPDDGGRRG